MTETWEIAGSGSACARCGEPIAAHVPFYSALCAAAAEEAAEEGGLLRRLDYCGACWEAGRGKPPAAAGDAVAAPAGVVAFWRTARVPPKERKRCYVKLDVDVVWRIFSSMAEEGSGGVEGELRYILALMLLRRRRLELGRRRDGVLEFRERKSGTVWRVVDPVLTEERIAALTARLGELLWEREFASLERS